MASINSGYKGVSFTKTDSMILEGYKGVVDTICNLLGPNCECVLHSLESLEHSVIYIRNGEKTNRHIGSPMTNKALSILKYCNDHSCTTSPIYKTTASNGRTMRSSTMIIRNFEGTPIGMMCINFDISAPFAEIAGFFLQGLEKLDEKTEHEEEFFAKDTEELFSSAVEKARNKVYADNSIGTRNKLKAIISILNSQGIFQVRNAVPGVARLLNVSKDAIYLHLRHQSKENS